MPRTPGVVEDRREQIMTAAMLVFARQGYTRASIKDIPCQPIIRKEENENVHIH